MIKRFFEWVLGMEIVNVNVSNRDMWVGVFWRDYYRLDKATPIDLHELKSDFCKALHRKTVATDIWFCPVPFLKFQFRVRHAELTAKDIEAMSDEGEILL